MPSSTAARRDKQQPSHQQRTLTTPCHRLVAHKPIHMKIIAIYLSALGILLPRSPSASSWLPIVLNGPWPPAPLVETAPLILSPSLTRMIRSHIILSHPHPMWHSSVVIWHFHFFISGLFINSPKSLVGSIFSEIKVYLCFADNMLLVRVWKNTQDPKRWISQWSCSAWKIPVPGLRPSGPGPLAAQVLSLLMAAITFCLFANYSLLKFPLSIDDWTDDLNLESGEFASISASLSSISNAYWFLLRTRIIHSKV